MSDTERCEDVLEDDGSRYRCVLLKGHTTPHENNGIEWWDAEPDAEGASE
jgi:hypothetical protein